MTARPTPSVSLNVGTPVQHNGRRAIIRGWQAHRRVLVSYPPSRAVSVANVADLEPAHPHPDPAP